MADVPLDARRVVSLVSVRRLKCGRIAAPGRPLASGFPACSNARLVGQIGTVVRELARRASARVLAVVATSRWPSAATMPHIIAAETRERIDVLTDRGADTVKAWLREHRGAEVVCRDGSGAYAEAIRRAPPQAVQRGDRWHIWHNLIEAVHKEASAHSGGWVSAGSPIRAGKRAATNRERWHQIHDLLGNGVGLLKCARRLNLVLNTVKRYARVPVSRVRLCGTGHS